MFSPTAVLKYKALRYISGELKYHQSCLSPLLDFRKPSDLGPVGAYHVPRSGPTVTTWKELSERWLSLCMKGGHWRHFLPTWKLSIRLLMERIWNVYSLLHIMGEFINRVALWGLCVNVGLSSGFVGWPCPLSIGIIGWLEQLALWKGRRCLLGLQPIKTDPRVGCPWTGGVDSLDAQDWRSRVWPHHQSHSFLHLTCIYWAPTLYLALF